MTEVEEEVRADVFVGPIGAARCPAEGVGREPTGGEREGFSSTQVPPNVEAREWDFCDGDRQGDGT